MSERHAETHRSITMIIDMSDGTTHAMTVRVDIKRWFTRVTGLDYRLTVHGAIYEATERLVRLAAGKLNQDSHKDDTSWIGREHSIGGCSGAGSTGVVGYPEFPSDW